MKTTHIASSPLTDLRIRHPRITQLMSDLSTSLDPEGAILAIMGPSGAGKTVLSRYLLETILKEYAGEMAMDAGLIPAIRVEAPSSGENEFSWRLFYQSILEGLGEDLTLPRQNYGVDPQSGRLFRPRQSGGNTLAALRRSVEQGVRERKLRVLLIDEAAHIIRQTSPKKLIIQLDTLKSLSNTSGVQMVIVGSYDLYDLVTLSGQLARRIHVMHFSRYREDVPEDVRAFRGCVKKFQECHPELWGNTLMENADALMENTLGCIGTLRDVLVRARNNGLARGWSKDALLRALLTEAQREQLLQEMLEGERCIAPGVTRALGRPKHTAHKAGTKSMQEAA